jgi:hypothetical protein
MLGLPYLRSGGVEVATARVEQTGQSSWRVRFRRAGGPIGSVPGFSSRRSAETYPGDVESDQRRQVWIDPADGRLVLRSWVGRWFPVQDLDPRTVDNYESYLGPRSKSEVRGRPRTTPPIKRT